MSSEAHFDDNNLLESMLRTLPDEDRLSFLEAISNSLIERGQRSNCVDDLNQAVAIKELLVSSLSTAPRHYYCVALDGLGAALQARFESTRQMNDIDRVIALGEQVLELVPSDSDNYIFFLTNLGTALQRRFQSSRVVDDIDRAIALFEQVISLLPSVDPRLCTSLDNLGCVIFDKYKHTLSINDLDKSISIKEQVVEMAHSDASPIFRNDLSKALQQRYAVVADLKDLERAIVLDQRAVDDTPPSHPSLAIRLNNFSTSLQCRFEATGAISDIDKAESVLERALEVTCESDPAYLIYLDNLNLALQRRFGRTGSIDDIDRAIVAGQKVLGLSSRDCTEYGRYLNNLGTAFQTRFSRMGLADDLDRAVQLNTEALNCTPLGHDQRWMYLVNLSSSLQRRYARQGSPEDLDRAIKLSEQSLGLLPNEHPDYRKCLVNFNIALRSQFVKTGSTADLKRITSLNEMIMTYTLESYADYPDRLHDLGITFQDLFEITGSRDDLDRALDLIRQSLSNMPDWHSRRPFYLSTLGTALLLRFEREGSTDDLDQALLLKEQAVQTTTPDHPDYPLYLNDLSHVCIIKFDRLGSTDDLERSIVSEERALMFIPKDHPERAALLQNLAAALGKRLGGKPSIHDLDRAVSLNNEATKSSWLTYLNHSRALNSFGVSLLDRFQRTGMRNDLDDAVAAMEEAIKYAKGSADSVGYLNNLGAALAARWRLTHSEEDLNHAIQMKKESVNFRGGHPSIRLRAAATLYPLLVGRDNHAAKSILESAVRLLPSISLRALKRSDQQHNLSQYSFITSAAVSLSLECDNDARKALQLLELGRGIIANLQLETRSDISRLENAYPDMARRFYELRDKINQSGRDSASMATSFNPQPERVVFRQFEDLLAAIRDLAEFKDFLLGPSESELRTLAEEGPIVVFNISELRSDAFLVTMEEVTSLRLPLLHLKDLEAHCKSFLAAVENTSLRNYHSAKSTVIEILKWLWNVAVGPILEELGLSSPATVPRNSLPRVWWVGNGLLNILPIHGAGYHDISPPRSALSFVISSYSPTVKSLDYARQLAKISARRENPSAILIGMPTTPDRENLAYVTEEIKDVSTLLSPFFDIAVLQNCTRSQVLSELSSRQLIHVSSHGYSATDPSQSGILLEDWKVAPLTVSDLALMKADHAIFAYLSACDTSKTRDIKLLDESISLSSAVQLSGYPSVVASLWRIVDEHSAQVAKDVYSEMLSAGRGENIDIRRSGEALHKAVCSLRDKTRVNGFGRRELPSDPLVWAPFIHIGV